MFSLIAANLLATACLFSAANGDIVYLKNGDRLSGAVSMSTAGTLVVDTEYAGKVEVALEHVHGVDTDTPVAVEWDDGTVSEGVLSLSGEGQLLGSGGDAALLDWKAVRRVQANTETMATAIAKAKKIWSGTVGSGAIFRYGEKDIFDANIDVAFKRKKPSNVLSLAFNASYGESEEQLNTQRLYGEAKWQIYPGKRFYYFVVGSAEHDKPRRLELRAKGGGGVGYDVIKNQRRSLSTDAGIEYVYERWDNFAQGEYRAAVNGARQTALDRLLALGGDITPGTLLEAAGLAVSFLDPEVPPKTRTDNYISGRFGMQYEQKLFNNSEFSNNLNVLPNMEDLGTFLLSNKLAFTTPFSDALSLRLQLRTEYDSEPETNVDEFDNTLSINVLWKY